MILPRIFVIDDLLGMSASDRASFCNDLALWDEENGQQPTFPENYLATAVFHPGVRREGAQVYADAAAIDQVLSVLAAGWDNCPARRYALVLLDLNFCCGTLQNADGPMHAATNWPRSSNAQHGLNILRALKGSWPDDANHERTAIPVVALSTTPRREVEQELARLGNCGYLSRTTVLDQKVQAIAPKELRISFKTLLVSEGLLPAGSYPRSAATRDNPALKPCQEPKILGNSQALLRVLRIAKKLAPTDISVLILGETGTGKEEFARLIHNTSNRSMKSFGIFSCGGKSDESSLESELFGHVKGAYTGAHGDKSGLLTEADGGTVFLDEVQDMSATLQTKLLRFLEDKKVIPKGATAKKHHEVDVRILGATNANNWDDLVKNRGIRDDLLFRFGACVLTIPPLRDRKEDIPLLFTNFLNDATAKYRGRSKEIEESVFQWLQNESWPGNVRELKKFAEHLAVMRMHSECIVFQDLIDFKSPVRTSVPISRTIDPIAAPLSLEELLVLVRTARLPGARSELKGKLAAAESAFGELACRLLRAMLEQTRNGAGEVQVATAIRELFGQPKMTSIAAYRALIKLHKGPPFSKINLEDPSSDPVAQALKLALQYKKDARSSKPSKKKVDE